MRMESLGLVDRLHTVVSFAADRPLRTMGQKRSDTGAYRSVIINDKNLDGVHQISGPDLQNES